MVKRDKVFQITDHIILFLLALFCILPLLLLFSSSFSNETAILHEGYHILPREFDLTAYKYILNGSSGILRSYGISAIITIAGTLGNLFLTILYAYPISRGDLKGRTFFSFFLFLTILFNGGLIPTYMMWTNTFHIKNSYLAYILPNLLMNGFFVIMARNFFYRQHTCGIAGISKNRWRWGIPYTAGYCAADVKTHSGNPGPVCVSELLE